MIRRENFEEDDVYGSRVTVGASGPAPLAFRPVVVAADADQRTAPR